MQNKMEVPQLSILIPSIPSRRDKANKLYDKIIEMVGDKNIEVLILTDNKKRSIGLKRDSLKNISRGKYFMIVDDDDGLDSINEVYEATFGDEVDVITFKQQCFNADGNGYIVIFTIDKIKDPIEHKTESKTNRYIDMHRPPWMVCAWNSFYKQFSYPDINYSEDYEWLKQCYPHVKTQRFIDKVIARYNFDPKVTEASTESNKFWKNPN